MAGTQRCFFGTIYFAIHYRGFRHGLLYILGGLTMLCVLGGLGMWYSSYQSAERRRAAAMLIKANEIKITGAKLSLGIAPELSGVVTNRSAYDLAELLIKVTVTDCPRNILADLIPPKTEETSKRPGRKPWEQFKKAQDTANCGIVGEDVVQVYSIDVPRGQKRAFSTFVSLRNLPKMKQWSWHYSIKKIIAKH